jgi:hypothetical protein
MIDYSQRHLRVGWWSLLLFGGAGLVLETLHGFKVSAYVDPSNETRRLMWTLAHAHGTLLAFIHLVFALALRSVPELRARDLRTISFSLVAASVMLPGGFFLGGVAFYSGDPGLGVLLVPFGALFLLASLYLIARAS